MKQFDNIPVHIAIIMDGNRRWARNRRLPALAGHKHAADHIVDALVEEAGSKGIKYITFWAWSTENWGREAKEVQGIMKLLLYYLSKKLDVFHKKGAKLKIIGDISKFSPNIQKSIAQGLEKTKNNTKITVIFALNYGGRDEILRAIKKLPATNYQLSTLDEKKFSELLDTNEIPDPDLIIRTGGEKRLSGFLLWQSEYSELYFTDTLFPDFDSIEFNKALEWFGKRNRRYGK